MIKALSLALLLAVPAFTACATTPLTAKQKCEQLGGWYKGNNLCEFQSPGDGPSGEGASGDAGSSAGTK